MQDQNKQAKKSINDKELEILKYWEDNNIFEKSIKSPAGREDKEIESFSFYDGPPFATGLPHHGHILAGTIKDAIPRYQTMQGKRVRRVWGWDCHGLPIENLVEKEFNLNSKKDIETYGIDKFNKAAAESVLRYETEWKKAVPRLGRWVDMDSAYKTMDWSYTESVWWVWKSLYEKGLAYEGHKIMHICPRCETPLAQSEVGLEYHDITDMTVTAEFKLKNKKYNNSDLYFLAWTTTPWTLPGNTALAVNKNLSYVVVESIFEEQKSYFIVAKKLAESVFSKSESFQILEDININDYIGESYEPVFNVFNNEEYLAQLENSENIWKIWHADFITDDAGTGIAHEAPAFGAEDMELARLNNIPIIRHVNMNGKFVSDVEDAVPELKGLVVKKKDDSISTDIEVVKWLAHNGKLFEKHKIVHSYPLCWRCKTPLLNYATSSWFVDVPTIKDKLISENSKVNWVPDHIKDGRFGKWLEGAREWAVSRRRYWGAPLPIWKSVDGQEVFVAGSLAEVAQRNKDKYKNKYIIMRHGGAKSNVENYYDDGSDTTNHLTDEGRRQVLSAAESLRSEGITQIFHSPIIRTTETAEIVAGQLSLKLEHSDALRESDDRDASGNLSVQMRMQGFIESCEASYNGETILIITHMAPARELLRQNALYNVNLKNAEYIALPSGKLPRDESHMLNLHKPYIDKIVLSDSKGSDMHIIGDVFDCWFESGSMPYAELHYPFENKNIFDNNFPADFIAEGMDQTRGWFYSLINLGVGLLDKAPFKNVIVNGIVLAGDGQKMSKSLKNYTDPMLLVEKFGADAIRFALMNSPVMRGESVAFGDEVVEEVYKKNVQRMENVLGFYLMYRSAKYDKEANANSTNVIDIWILSRLNEVINSSIKGYNNYELDIAVSGVSQFVDDLSTWYLRRSRDRLKDLDAEALQTIGHVLVEFAKVIAPAMPFLAEQIYQEVVEGGNSVHLQSYPSSKDIDNAAIDDMRIVREVVTSLLMIRQKNNLPVRQPLLSATINKSISQKYFDIIADEVNVKEIKVDESKEICELDMILNPELIREGKQRELSREIKDKRKEMGLVATDEVILFIDAGRADLLDDQYKLDMKIQEVNIDDVLRIEKAL